MVTKATDPPVTLPQPVIVTSSKANPSPQVSKGALVGQGRRSVTKGKVLSHLEKERKILPNQLLVQPLWLAYLLT